jgi:hypothetical protein
VHESLTSNHQRQQPSCHLLAAADTAIDLEFWTIVLETKHKEHIKLDRLQSLTRSQFISTSNKSQNQLGSLYETRVY